MTSELHTERLLLHAIDESHADQLLDYAIRNEQFLAEWEPVRAPDYYTLEAQREVIAGDLANIARGQMFKVWLSTKEEPGKLIGSIALSNIVRGAFQSCHLGYRLDREEKNKGYMAEGLRRVIRIAFQDLKLHRIEANIMPRNLPSLRVVEKLGFFHEGLARKYLKINGKWEDHVHMVLLNEEME